MFESLGVALLQADADQALAITRAAAAHALHLEPERCVRASTCAPGTDTASATWGLEAIGIPDCRYSGHGIRVAVLDTGLDFQHPDFVDRDIVAQSFVAGLSVEDRNGHGTHSAGIACGPKHPSESPRYGVAFGADLYVARVLDDRASGADGNILAGIDWAVRNECPVIAMSLGTPVSLGDSYSRVFEQIASRALAAGSLLVAAAGNESSRPETIAPVEHPANCPSILAVGAVGTCLALAPFSNGSLNADGGCVDLVAPGIAIVSCAPQPDLYQTQNGTSPATLYVAGIAALLAEAHPAARGAALRTLLLRHARRLDLPARDVGAGLAQAPR